MTWPIGISWTPGHFEEVTAPLEKQRLLIAPQYEARIEYIDGVPNLVTWMYVHAGPFLHLRFLGLKLYWGFRPSAPWPAGFGDEGLFGWLARWLKQHDMGNLAILPTIKKA